MIGTTANNSTARIERAWWEWHYREAVKNGLPEAYALRLANEALWSLRKYGL